MDRTRGKTAVKPGILLGSAIFRRYTPVLVRLSTAYAQELWPTSVLRSKFAGHKGWARVAIGNCLNTKTAFGLTDLRHNISAALNGELGQRRKSE